jgi:hypothetical protein
MVFVLVSDVVFVLVFRCRRRLGRWRHWRAATPEEPKKGGTDLARWVMVLGRSATRARSGHSVAATTGQTGQGVATRVWVLGDSR